MIKALFKPCETLEISFESICLSFFNTKHPSSLETKNLTRQVLKKPVFPVLCSCCESDVTALIVNLYEGDTLVGV